MKNFYFFVAGVVVVVGAGLAAAQQAGEHRHPGFAQGPPPLLLLQQKSVEQELKLTAEQVGQVHEAAKKQREAYHQVIELAQADRDKKFPELYEQARAAVAHILTVEQAGRLRQIAWQEMGGRALLLPPVAKELNLTEEQKQQLAAIGKETHEQAKKLFGDGAARTEETKAKFAEVRKTASDRMLAVLSAEQSAQWKVLLGAPFVGEIHAWRHHG
jgi:Spy/CpxP family protein refolding chaperone